MTSNNFTDETFESDAFPKEEKVSLNLDIPKEDLWQNIGFHRPIAGFFYNLPLTFISMIISIIAVGWLTQFLYPYPEPMGYRAVSTGIFALMIEAFDLGTANMLNRFIGANTINPQRMILYIQYFIWYQMITGLIQTTFISIYALYFVPQSQLGYAVWILLIFSTTQYPGMLGIFRGVMNSLQQYNKTAVLGFLSGQVFQRITEVVFILWGRYYGMHHPEIGDIMGIAIGASIGFYIDDFIATAVSALFFRNVIKHYGYTIKDCFRHDFDRALLWECFSWGLRSGLPSLLWGVVSFTELLLWLTYVPQIATFKAFFDIAGGFTGLVMWNIDLGGSISEAFFNDKKELAQYYISQSWRYTGMIQILMISVIFIVVLVLKPMFIFLNIEYQILAIPFILPRVIRDIQQPYNNISMNIISSTGHVNFQAFTNVIESLLSILAWIILIPVLKIPQTYGMIAVMWMLPCAELPAILTKIILQYLYVHKKVLKLIIPWYQTFVPSLLTAIIYYSLGIFYVNNVFYPMEAAFGTLIAIIPMAILFIIIGPFLFFFPLTGLLGGWDEGSLKILETASKISGMGKIFSLVLYKMLIISSKRSPLHGKFGVDESKAIQQVRELMEIRNRTAKDKVKVI